MPTRESGRKGVLGHGLDALKRLQKAEPAEAARPAARAPASKKRQKMLPPSAVAATPARGLPGPDVRAGAVAGSAEAKRGRKGKKGNKAGGPHGGPAVHSSGENVSGAWQPGSRDAGLAQPPGQNNPAALHAAHQRAEQAAAPLDPADRALFRRAMAAVAPIKDTRRAVLPMTHKDAPDVLCQRRERASGQSPKTLPAVSDAFAPAATHEDDSRYLRSPDSANLIKQLERGRWTPQAVLDLHGDTLEQARERLDRFLQSCLEHEIRCVRIVHGKGHGSRDGQPVLKSALRRWLTQLSTVQAYVQCNEEDGGAGAVHVLLG